MCKVSYTSIPCLPSSQATRRFFIRRYTAWDAVTCRARCSIIIWKTMNCSKFHFLSRTPRRSPPSVPKNCLRTFLLGVSCRLYVMTARSLYHACHSASSLMLPYK